MLNRNFLSAFLGALLFMGLTVSCDVTKTSSRDNSSIGGSTDSMEMPRSSSATTDAARTNDMDRTRTPRVADADRADNTGRTARTTDSEIERTNRAATDVTAAERAEMNQARMDAKANRNRAEMDAKTDTDRTKMDAKTDRDNGMDRAATNMKMDLPSGEMYRTMSVKEDLPSPRRKMQAELAGSKVMVDYGSPSMNKRELYGKLVPYGQVWRSGANEATTVTFDKDVLVEGKMLKAGTYALFTIPEQDEWTVIFSKTAEQWGAYKYDMKDDALRVKVKPRAAAKSTEQLYYGAAKDELNLNWGDKVVPIKVTKA
ncbi:MAG: DUF2911 domain-containing protein [Saprospiraceae bacterium]